jgi:hypothetical protein
MLTTLRRLVVVCAAVTVLIGLARAPAWAGFGDPVNCEEHPTNPECQVDVGTPGGSGGGSGPGCHNPSGQAVPCYIPGKGWYDGDWCWWQPATGDLLADLISRLGEPRPPEAWFTATCGDPITGDWSPTTMYALMDANTGVEVLAAQAVRSLVLPAPAIRLNPSPPAAQLVFVPTWLWLDGSSWGARSATASVPGLSVTATATPVSVAWSTGDNTTVTCQGAGTPWSGGDPMAESPDCGHTYTRHSGAGVFTVRATITWNVTWVGGGTSGTEPALTSTATADIRVAQSPTVITGGS